MLVLVRLRRRYSTSMSSSIPAAPSLTPTPSLTDTNVPAAPPLTIPDDVPAAPVESAAASAVVKPPSILERLGLKTRAPSPPVATSSPSSTASIPAPPPIDGVAVVPAKKWTVVDEQTVKLDLSHATAAPIPRTRDDDTATWLTSPTLWCSDGITGVSRSSVGSGGVMFIGTQRGVLVLKSSANCAQEMFGARLAERLNIPTSAMWLQRYDATLWPMIKQSVGDAGNEGDRRKLDALMERLVISFIEFTPSQCLDAISSEQAAAYFTEQRLQELGSIVVLDLLINNSDRIPCQVWSNEGNPGNLLLGKQLYSIDCCSSTHPADSPQAKLYFTSVSALASQLATVGHNSTGVMEIANFIKSFCGWDMSEPGRRAVYRGMLDTIRRASALTLGDVDIVKNELQRVVARDWQNVWHDMMITIHSQFVVAVAKVLSVALSGTAAMDDAAALECKDGSCPPTSDLTSIPPNVKFAVAQLNPMTPDDAASWLDAYLSSFPDRQGHINTGVQGTGKDGMMHPLAKLTSPSTQTHSGDVKESTTPPPAATAVAPVPASPSSVTSPIPTAPILVHGDSIGRTSFKTAEVASAVNEAMAAAVDVVVSGTSPYDAYRKPDVVVFPEGWCVIDGKMVDAKHPFVAAVAPVAAKHGVFISLGTFDEIVPGNTTSSQVGTVKDQRFITTTLLSDEGWIVAKYRKQRVHEHRLHTQGDTPVTAHTRCGLMAILICLDIEVPEVLNGTLLMKPQFILNPSHIPMRGVAHDDEVARFNTWRTSLDLMSRKYERTTSTHATTVVRADLPSWNGAGTSQVIGGAGNTVVASHPGAHVITAFASLNQKENNFWLSMRAADDARSAVEDNTGSRYIQQTMAIELAPGGGRGGTSGGTRDGVTCIDGGDTELLVGTRCGFIQVWRIGAAGKRLAFKLRCPPGPAISPTGGTAELVALHRLSPTHFVAIVSLPGLVQCWVWPLPAADRLGQPLRHAAKPDPSVADHAEPIPVLKMIQWSDKSMPIDAMPKLTSTAVVRCGDAAIPHIALTLSNGVVALMHLEADKSAAITEPLRVITRTISPSVALTHVLSVVPTVSVDPAKPQPEANTFVAVDASGALHWLGRDGSLQPVGAAATLQTTSLITYHRDNVYAAVRVRDDDDVKRHNVRVAIGDTNGAIVITDLPTSAVASLAPFAKFVSHRGAVSSLRWISPYVLLSSSATDGTMKLWRWNATDSDTPPVVIPPAVAATETKELSVSPTTIRPLVTLSATITTINPPTLLHTFFAIESPGTQLISCRDGARSVWLYSSDKDGGVTHWSFTYNRAPTSVLALMP